MTSRWFWTPATQNETWTERSSNAPVTGQRYEKKISNITAISKDAKTTENWHYKWKPRQGDHDRQPVKRTFQAISGAKILTLICSKLQSKSNFETAFPVKISNCVQKPTKNYTWPLNRGNISFSNRSRSSTVVNMSGLSIETFGIFPPHVISENFCFVFSVLRQIKRNLLDSFEIKIPSPGRWSIQTANHATKNVPVFQKIFWLRFKQFCQRKAFPQ